MTSCDAVLSLIVVGAVGCTGAVAGHFLAAAPTGGRA